MKNIKNFEEFINEGAETTGTVGSGTAVSGPSFSGTQLAGIPVTGGDSIGGTSYSTLGNTSGMGTIHSAQPSSVPGDVAGSTKGSGDISKGIGPYTKSQTLNKRGKKRKDKYTKIGANIDNFYRPKYTEKSNKSGKIISNWKVFTQK
jgi:hypothetical protein